MANKLDVAATDHSFDAGGCQRGIGGDGRVDGGDGGGDGIGGRDGHRNIALRSGKTSTEDAQVHGLVARWCSEGPPGCGDIGDVADGAAREAAEQSGGDAIASLHLERRGTSVEGQLLLAVDVCADGGGDVGVFERRRLLARAVSGIGDGLVERRYQGVGVGHTGQVHGYCDHVRSRSVGEARPCEIEIRRVVGDGSEIGGVGDDVLHTGGAADPDIGARRARRLHTLQAEALAVNGGFTEVDGDASVGAGADAVGRFAAADEDAECLRKCAALIQADGLRLAVDFIDYALEFRIQHAAIAGKSAGGGLRG